MMCSLCVIGGVGLFKVSAAHLGKLIWLASRNDFAPALLTLTSFACLSRHSTQPLCNIEEHAQVSIFQKNICIFRTSQEELAPHWIVATGNLIYDNHLKQQQKIGINTTGEGPVTKIIPIPEP
jgi:hypothetical protein